MNFLEFIKNLFVTTAYAATLPQTPWGFPLLRDANPVEYDLSDVLRLIGNFINIAMTLAAVIAVIYIIIGGYKYVMSSGNPEGIQQAKSTLFAAIAGLVICIAVVVILRFVWNHIIGGTLPEQVP